MSMILFCSFPAMTELSFHWSRLRQGSTECPKLDKAFPRCFNASTDFTARRYQNYETMNSEWTLNELWMNSEYSEWLERWPYHARTVTPYSNHFESSASAPSHPSHPPDLSLERTERTERTTGHVGGRLAFAACGGRLDSAACSIQRCVASALSTLKISQICSMKNISTLSDLVFLKYPAFRHTSFSFVKAVLNMKLTSD